MTTTAPSAAETALSFGDQALLDRSLSDMVHRLRGSVILRIAADVRAMIAAGKPVCNLTAGDFDPRQFPIPEALAIAIRKAFEAGETNYPPSEGMLTLRKAVAEYVAREHQVRYPVESVLIAAGGRPIVYATYRAVINPGDTVVYSVPSWNNDYYAEITEAKAVELVASRENGFQPTLAEIEPHLTTAALLCLCSPGNPTGTMMPTPTLREILGAVVRENERRRSTGQREMFVFYDQIYSGLAFAAEHEHPAVVVPEAAPYLIVLDGISKAFAATGLRLGWVTAAPAVVARMKDFLGHVGAWAPRPEQVGTAAFLSDPAAVADYRAEMHQRATARLEALYQGFTALKRSGYPVDCVDPQGAIYLSLRLDLVGKSFNGKAIATNEDIRQIMLEQAGLGVVPFQAFGLDGETGWFRMSVGAVSLQDIADAFPRIRGFLDGVR
ncbi:MAG: aminotransferase class I/II-fold pyridoxal phosphate-dependent enzyme [Gemmatimonadetes bacterium]|nr:aminotransferase class I/II-fold pyridoxal phosphate-dependent enzyme [Gemmatimonadota bacterium]